LIKKTSQTNFLKDTWVFCVEIVKGGGTDSKQVAEVVPALALFNASSEHSWISEGFAEKLNIEKYSGKLSKQEAVDDQTLWSPDPVKLAWKCSSISPYVQRTVFMIAPAAKFDLLFAEQKERNLRPLEPDQFQKGIQQGLFEKMVELGALLPVIKTPTASTGNDGFPNSHLCGPTLAQLEDQLVADAENHRCYHLMHDCNIRSVGCVQASCRDLLNHPPGVEQSHSNDSSTAPGRVIEEKDARVYYGLEIRKGYDSWIERCIKGERGKYPVKRPKVPEVTETQGYIDGSIGSCQLEIRPEFLLGTLGQVKKGLPEHTRCGQTEQNGGAADDTFLHDGWRSGSPSANSVPFQTENASHPDDCSVTILAAAAKNGSLEIPDSKNLAPTGTRHVALTLNSELIFAGSGLSSSRSSTSELSDPEYWTWDNKQQNHYHIDKTTGERLWYGPTPP
jgi:hypothetical protein